jgi:hypothetical protein
MLIGFWWLLVQQSGLPRSAILSKNGGFADRLATQ